LISWNGINPAQAIPIPAGGEKVVIKAQVQGNSSCALAMAIQSDSGALDQFTATPSGNTTTLELTQGNWTLGFAPVDDQPSSDPNFMTDCQETDLNVEVLTP
jgi:hypothetical protein